MLLLSEIAQRIATVRKAAKLTQAGLAAKAGVSRVTIDALENGRIGELGFNKVSRILAGLNLELRIREANLGRPTLDELEAENRAEDAQTRELERQRRLKRNAGSQKGLRHD